MPKWFTLKEDISGLFLAPDGTPIYLSLNANDSIAVLQNADGLGVVGDFETRAIYGFSQNGIIYFAEMQGYKFMRFCKFGTTEEYIDKQTEEKLKDKAYKVGNFNEKSDHNQYKVYLWRNSIRNIDEGIWFTLTKSYPCIYYDYLHNCIITVSDISNPFILNLGNKKFDYQEIRNKKCVVKHFTEKELLESEYNPVIRNIQNANREIVKDAQSFLSYLTKTAYLSLVIDWTFKYIIEQLSTVEAFDDKSIQCLKQLWNGNEGEYIKDKISNLLLEASDYLLSDEGEYRDKLIDEISILIIKDKACDKFVNCLVTIICSLMNDEMSNLCLSNFWEEYQEYINNKLSDGETLQYILKFEHSDDLFKRLKEKFGSFFNSEKVTDQMSECLITYSKSLCDNVELLNEQDKQQIFLTDPTKSVGILLYEFASGTGEKERVFSEGAFFDAYLHGGINIFNEDPNSFINIESKVKELFIEYIHNKKLTFDGFKKKGNENIIFLNFSPTSPSSLVPAYYGHKYSNLSQLFVGGATAFVTNIGESKNKFNVTINNETSKNSLFLHISENEETENDKMRTIKQHFNFVIEYDEPIFK